jgi:osmotically inducible protein OsmC
VGDASITANVDFGKTEDGGFGFGVELIGHLPDLSREEAQELMEEAHEVCLYSSATRDNIDVKLTVGDWRTVRVLGGPRTDSLPSFAWIRRADG